MIYRKLRQRKTIKVLACFLAINMLCSTLFPTISLALTHGPHQPEYTSYESPGNSDMVNLLTGDFSFNIPVLDVPGPEGGFTLPLSYHAGIGLEQEASWVGLGWSLNAGAITRSIVEYPDDASGQVQTINVQDPGQYGWASTVLGLGQIGWDSENGKYGSLSLLGLLSYSYDEDGSTVGVAGVNFSSNGVSVDPVGVALAALTIASLGATAASANAAAAGAAGAKAGAAIGAGKAGAVGAKAIATQVGTDLAISAGLSTVFSSQTPSLGAQGFWQYQKKVKQRLFHKKYWIWLDQTRNEQMYGVLNLGDVSPENYTQSNNIELNLNVEGNSKVLKQFSTDPTNEIGSASDMLFFMDDDEQYHSSNRPAGLAFDNYNVTGPGVSGSIAPYRFEIGSLAAPRGMDADHKRLYPIDFMDYKVPFLYKGSFSNKYFHHVGGSTTPTTPTPHFGISHAVGNTNPQNNTSLTYDLDDVIFDSERIPTSVQGHKLDRNNHIEWYTNAEIRTSQPFTDGFVDFLPQTERDGFREEVDLGLQTITTSDPLISDGVTFADVGSYFAVNDVVTVTITRTDNTVNPPQTLQQGYVTTVDAVNTTTNTVTFDTNGWLAAFLDPTPSLGQTVAARVNKMANVESNIGGYSITRPDGKTFHYALPVYDHSLETRITNVDDPDITSVIYRGSPFPNSWLLTTITGPDFVDRDGSGTANAGDWGHWINLSYGEYDNDYRWKTPFDGTKRTPDDKSDVVTEGVKQLYYLNQIQTRSHTAMFFKDIRSDGKGFSDAGLFGNTLSLNEIYLLTNEKYEELIDPAGVNFSLANNGGLTNVWNMLDLAGNSTAQTFLDANTLGKVVFNYNYDLASNTPNSSATGGGRLTLESLSILGKNNVKTFPDYTFHYAHNPAFEKYDWDGWGMYNPTGNASGSSHKASDTDLDATAWSLTKVVMPLGNELHVEYERDTYSSISGHPVKRGVYTTDTDWSNGISVSGDTDGLAVNDLVTVEGDVYYSCDGTTGPMALLAKNPYSATATVTAVTANSISLNYTYPTPTCGQGETLNVQYVTGNISKSILDRKGGNLRVASITASDNNGQSYKTRYLYTLENDPNNTSSGSIAKEPDYIRESDLEIYDLPDYPFTPVLYGTVTVLQGRLSNDTDYHTKQVFKYQTPTEEMVALTNSTTVEVDELIYSDINDAEKVTISRFNFENKAAKIGQPTSVEIKDAGNNTVQSTTFFYAEDPNNNQGVYTNGALVADRIENSSLVYHKLSRTTSITYPSVLTKITTVKDGQTSIIENKDWDSITGNVIEKETTTPLGLKFRSVTVPAYTISDYSGMGSKATNIANAHMLSQPAAQYTYKINSSGNIIGLVSASAQTWKKDWSNYRNVFVGTYVDNSTGPQVWRLHEQYIFEGSDAFRDPVTSTGNLLDDGTYDPTAFSVFDFDNLSNNTDWLQTSSINRYDPYSMPLETEALGQVYAASKMGYDDNYKLAEVTNARFGEFAYSGAEDKIDGLNFFGGEVGLGNGTVATTTTHTGASALQLASGQKGFEFTATELRANRYYRLLVWANSENAEFFYRLNGGTEASLPAVMVGSHDGWYLLQAEVNSGSSPTSLQVGVKSTSGTIVVDDFRFHPTTSGMTSYVYDDFGRVQYILDNSNRYLRYQYNDEGRIESTHVETFQYGEIKLTSSNIHYRRN